MSAPVVDSVVDLTVSDDDDQVNGVNNNNAYNLSQNDSIAATLDGDSDIEEVVFENLSDNEIARRISAANQLRIQRLRRREQERRDERPADQGDGLRPWQRNGFPHALPDPPFMDREVIEISSGDEAEPNLVEDIHRARRRLQRAARQAQDAVEEPRRRRGMVFDPNLDDYPLPPPIPQPRNNFPRPVRNAFLIERGRQALHHRDLYLEALYEQNQYRPRNAAARNRQFDFLGGIRATVGALGNMLGWGVNDPDPPVHQDFFLPEPDEPAPLHIPDAPDYQVSFTHPTVPAGFTADFEPVEPDTITLDGSSDEGSLFNDETVSQRKKGKGKMIREPTPEPTPTTVLTLVCIVCRDPLTMGGDKRLYGLRCGHVIDDKCLWRIGKPPDKASEAPALASAVFQAELAKREIPANPSSGLSDVASITGENGSAVYQEDNDPEPAPVASSSSGRRHGGVVPAPNSFSRRSRRLHAAYAADGVDEQLPSNLTSSVPPLDISNPMLPVLNPPPLLDRINGIHPPSRNPPILSDRVRDEPLRRSARRGAKGKKMKTRSVGGRLREDVYEWACPVNGCGKVHASVRLQATAAPWRCDPVRGAIQMFL